MERRLAAVLAADVVGYSRLMGADEEGTLARLKAARMQLIDPKVGEHHGRLVSTAGDGMLVEFASVVEALRCAVEIQRGMQARNAGTTEDQHIQFRVGINVGDIIIDGTDIFGDGVNVAARLEAMAEPGGICVSGRVFEDARGKLELAFEDTGEQRFKNIEWPVRVHRVRLDGTAAAAKRGDPALPDKPSIAVLPFTNMSGDPAEEYFSDGITEDITTELSRFRSLFVIARNSAFSYKGRSPKVQDVGRELGVQYIVEGSVRRAGKVVRVTAQLVTAATGVHVWAERFDRDAGDIFAVQDEIVRTIVSTLVGRIDEAGKSQVKRLSSEGLRAYDLYLKALAAQDSNTREAYAEAEAYLRQAIALDPDLPQAHHHLSLVRYVNYMAFWVADRDGAFAESFAEAEKALALDETSSSLHAHFGLLLMDRGKYDEARDHFMRAMRMNPNDVKALSLYGFFLTGMHELDEALACFDQAVQLNPLAPNWTNWLRGIAYFTARRYADAIRILTSIRTPMNEVHGWLAASYAHAGNLERARASLETFLGRAEAEMVRCPPRELRAWRSFWYASMPYAQKDDVMHLMDGLGKAGLGETR